MREPGSGRLGECLQSSNQYSVSDASFEAIFSLCIKSLLLSGDCASKTFAPIEVPLLSNCLAMVYLRFSSSRSVNSITSSANLKEVSTIRFPVAFIFVVL